MNKIKFFFIAMSLCGISFAGENELTIHSRAGCPMPEGSFLNESVNWDGSGKVRHHIIKSFHGVRIDSLAGPSKFNWIHTKFANGYEVPNSSWQRWLRDNDPFDPALGKTGTWAEAADQERFNIDKKHKPKYYFKVQSDHFAITDGVKSYYGSIETDQCPQNDWSKIKYKTTLKNSKQISENLDYNFIPKKLEALKGIHLLPANEIYFSSHKVKKEEVIYDNSENPFRDKLLKFREEGFNYYRAEAILKSPSITAIHSYKEVRVETDMQPSYDLIPLAFEYKGIPRQDKNKIVGYAPALSQVDGKWTGIGSYFLNPELGSCHYVIYNIKLTGGGAELPSELVSYDVNNKPTISKIVVNDNSDAVYMIDWYDNTFIHKLQCANKHDIDLFEKILKLAKILDKESQ